MKNLLTLLAVIEVGLMIIGAVSSIANWKMALIGVFFLSLICGLAYVIVAVIVANKECIKNQLK